MPTQDRQYPPELPQDPVRIGISRCLLGEKVRYDGRHKHDAYITDILGDYFEWVPFCPEVEAGFGVPRAPIQLVAGAGEPRALRVHDLSYDATPALTGYARSVMPQILPLQGFILKSRSPSCGMEKVPLYKPGGEQPMLTGTGVFARLLMHTYPYLPIAEEESLHDPVERASFVHRIFNYGRWQKFRSEGISANGLMEFHRRHQFQLLAHSPSVCHRLNQRLACTEPSAEWAEAYIRIFMAAMKSPPTRSNHAKVLRYLLGELDHELQRPDKILLGETIDRFQRGELPLWVPIVRFKHQLHQHPKPHLEKQTYLNPQRAEWALCGSL